MSMSPPPPLARGALVGCRATLSAAEELDLRVFGRGSAEQRVRAGETAQLQIEECGDVGAFGSDGAGRLDGADDFGDARPCELART
jgi:hypothetical protein